MYIFYTVGSNLDSFSFSYSFFPRFLHCFHYFTNKVLFEALELEFCVPAGKLCIQYCANVERYAQKLMVVVKKVKSGKVREYKNGSFSVSKIFFFISLINLFILFSLVSFDCCGFWVSNLNFSINFEFWNSCNSIDNKRKQQFSNWCDNWICGLIDQTSEKFLMKWNDKCLKKKIKFEICSQCLCIMCENKSWEKKKIILCDFFPNANQIKKNHK